jgi:hypothetical protein
MPPLLLLIHLAATALYGGVLWIVQLAVYPQFRRIPEAVFAAYHAEHCRRLGWVVAPLFLLEGITALLAAWLLWPEQPVLQFLSLTLYGLGHGLTFSLFIPLHQKLGQGPPQPTDLDRLVLLNGTRVAVAMARLLLVILFTVDVVGHG